MTLAVAPRKSRSSLKTLAMLVVAVAASVLLSYAIHHRLLVPASAREDAFDAIAAGQLSADERGVVALPEQWRSASLDQRAYVTGKPGETLWVLFVVERGVGRQLRGYLFCTKPAAARATGAVTLRFPSDAGNEVEVTVRRVLNPSCFEVVRELK